MSYVTTGSNIETCGFNGNDDIVSGINSTSYGINGVSCEGFQSGGSKRKGSKRKGSKRKGSKRRKMSKRAKLMSQYKIKSMKEYKRKKKQRITTKKKRKQFHQSIIKSIEEDKPISDKSIKELSPSVKEFLSGIDSKSSVTSTLRFSDFKSKSKSKSKKKKPKRTRSRGGYKPRCYIHRGEIVVNIVVDVNKFDI